VTASCCAPAGAAARRESCEPSHGEYTLPGSTGCWAECTTGKHGVQPWTPSPGLLVLVRPWPCTNRKSGYELHFTPSSVKWVPEAAPRTHTTQATHTYGTQPGAPDERAHVLFWSRLFLMLLFTFSLLGIRRARPSGANLLCSCVPPYPWDGIQQAALLT
jgi:hypothetical protein